MATRPFGSWPSPLSATEAVASARTPTALAADRGIVWWSESRPDEAGREAVVRRDGDGTLHEVLPRWFDARSRVHEYGGGAWWVHDETVYAVSWDDQRLYRLDPAHPPLPVTPEPPTPQAWRYADGDVTPDGRWVVCVRERHEGPDAATDVHNEVVAIRSDGSVEPVILVADTDFVAAPRVSRDGRQLAWIGWNHPNMPWDSTALYVARLSEVDGVLSLDDPRREAGGAGESLVQPEWGRHATLYVCSDRSDWWNVYRVDGVDRLSPVVSVDAEVSLPAWVLGQRRFLVRADGSLAIVHEEGTDAVLTSVSQDGRTETTTIPGGSVAMLADDGEALVGIVARLDRPVEICRLPDGDVLRAGSGAVLPTESVSVPTRVTFSTGGGEDAFAWFHPPVNPAAQGPDGERPPLLVLVHGGPTSAASPWYSPKVQFWTSRGFAVAAVDYRGSTGYGRRFRELLHGQWCVADVEDVCAAAAYLGEQGLVDATRAAIRGGSAGGTTALLATLRHDVFAAAVVMCAVTDLEALMATTHKFESRYLDSVLGPAHEAAETLRERSPLAHTDGARVPTLVLQGLDDAVVPPEQAELVVAAFAQRGVPHAYLAFEGEQHGFRSADAQVKALEAELDFLGQVFGFVPADEVPHVPLSRSPA